jgi:hypothetical protein
LSVYQSENIELLRLLIDTEKWERLPVQIPIRETLSEGLLALVAQRSGYSVTQKKKRDDEDEEAKDEDKDEEVQDGDHDTEDTTTNAPANSDRIGSDLVNNTLRSTSSSISSSSLVIQHDNQVDTNDDDDDDDSRDKHNERNQTSLLTRMTRATATATLVRIENQQPMTRQALIFANPFRHHDIWIDPPAMKRYVFEPPKSLTRLEANVHVVVASSGALPPKVATANHDHDHSMYVVVNVLSTYIHISI